MDQINIKFSLDADPVFQALSMHCELEVYNLVAWGIVEDIR